MDPDGTPEAARSIDHIRSDGNQGRSEDQGHRHCGEWDADQGVVRHERQPLDAGGQHPERAKCLPARGEQRSAPVPQVLKERCLWG